MKVLHIILILIVPCLSKAQSRVSNLNLVPNPSFEDTVMYGNGYPGVRGWQTNIGTPDYFSEYYSTNSSHIGVPSNSRGGQYAKEGVAFFGFGVLYYGQTKSKEYIQIELTDSLKQGEQYEVEFYISLADSFHLALHDTAIGIAFKDQLQPNNLDHKVREIHPYYTSDIKWNAQNKNGWEKFLYTHTAVGGEKALIIGCFLKDSELKVDTVGNGGNFPYAYNGSYYYIDDISVRKKDTSTTLAEIPLQEQLKLYPNPVNDVFSLEAPNSQPLSFSLHSIKGESIPSQVVQQHSHYRFSLGDLPKGIYFLKVNGKQQQATFKLIVAQ